jgi:hypothetical protein
MVPLWQVAHWLATGICVWFHFTGFQPVALGLWQVSQFRVVGMCPLTLPGAMLPLWHEAQLVAAVKLLWLGLACCQSRVEMWQLSQAEARASGVLWIGVLALPVVP